MSNLSRDLEMVSKRVYICMQQLVLCQLYHVDNKFTPTWESECYIQYVFYVSVSVQGFVLRTYFRILILGDHPKRSHVDDCH